MKRAVMLVSAAAFGAIAQEAPPPPEEVMPPAPPPVETPVEAPPAPVPTPAEVEAAAKAAAAAASAADAAADRQDAINAIGKAAEQGDISRLEALLATIDVKSGKISSTEEYREGYSAYQQALNAVPSNVNEVIAALNKAGMDPNYEMGHIAPPIWFATTNDRVPVETFDVVIKLTSPSALNHRDGRGYAVLYRHIEGCMGQAGATEDVCTKKAKALIEAGASTDQAMQILNSNVYHWARPLVGLTREVMKTEEEV